MQFRIPINEGDDYPKTCRFKGKSFAVDHALPFATPVSTRARPPHEQTVHEHWKKSTRLAPQDKKLKGHAICIAKTENCPRSLQRVIRLRESSYQSNAARLSIYTEQAKMPWCFFIGLVDESDALDTLSKCGIAYLENKDEVDFALENRDKDSVLLGESYCETAAIHIIKACCNDEQTLQIGFFHEGKYGWTVSTSELVLVPWVTPSVKLLQSMENQSLAK